MPEERDYRRIILHVYNQQLPITISVDEEEMYRNAAKLVSDKVNFYANASKHSKVNDQMMLYMVLVDIAMMYQREHAKSDDLKDMGEILVRLTSEIEDALKNEEK